MPSRQKPPLRNQPAREHVIKHGLTAAVAAAALAVAGCGGGDDNKTLSYSDFSQQANDICKSANDKVASLDQKLSGRAATDAPVYDTLIPELESARNDISKLKPPEELQADFDKFVAITGRQLEAAKKAQTQAKAGNQVAYIATIKATQPLSKQSNLLGSKLGAAECAK